MSVLSKYEKFLQKNTVLVESIERLSHGVMFFFMDPENELQTEIGYTFLNLVSLFHETLLSKEAKTLLEDERFKLYQKLGTWLRVINNVEVCVELIAHRWDRRKKWFFVLAIELIKTMLKTVSIVKNGLFVDYSVLPTPIQLKRENKFEQEMKMFPVDGKRQSIGRRTGKEMPDIYGGSPFAPKKALWKADKIKNQYILLGEIIHAWRPVLYVLCLMRFGRKSWIPWLISFGLDLLSKKLSTMGRLEDCGVIPTDEMYRRARLLSYYLYRSPMFDTIVAPLVKWLCRILSNVPLLSTLIVNVLEYYMALQPYYFYTSMS